MKDKQCPKCGSLDVIAKVPIADHGHHNTLKLLSAYIVEKSSAFFPEISFFKIRAWICGECGYTELYTENPHEVANSYRRYLENIKKKDQ